MAGSRALHSIITTELAKGKINYCHLYKLEFNATYIYTDAKLNIAYDGQSYLSNAFIQNSSTIREEGKLTTGKVTLQMSGVDQTFITEFLTNGYIQKQITISRAFLSDDFVVLNSGSNYAVEIIFRGNVADFSVEDTMESTQVKLGIENHWAQFGRIAGRVTTPDSSNQFTWQNYDKAFDWMVEVNKDAPTLSSGAPSFVYNR